MKRRAFLAGAGALAAEAQALPHLVPILLRSRGAGTIVITDNTTPTGAGTKYTGTSAARIAQAVAGTSFGNETVFIVSDDTGTNKQHSVIRFNRPSDWVNGRTVSAVTLKLNQSTAGASARDIDFHECLRAWVITGNNATGVSWNNWAGTGNAWATAGGTGAGDITASALGTVSFPSTTGFQTLTSAALATAVQSAFNAGDNFDLLIKMQTEAVANIEKRFTSPTGTDGSRPELYVTYA